MSLCTADKFRNICHSISVDNPETILCDKIPAFHSPNIDGSMGGFGALLLSLAKKHKQSLLGNSVESEAVVRQWIEYFVCQVNNMESYGLTHRILKDINDSLATLTYFAGNSKTLADIVLYHLLHEYMSKLSFQEKEKYIHLSRWYNNIQQDATIRGNNVSLTFSRTPLY